MAKGLRWDAILLAIILLGFFWLRLVLATSVESLSYDSYLLVRNVDHIRETGKPLSDDPLSLTGTKRVGSPVFPYLLAAFSFLGDSMYKILPNLFMVLLLIPVFLITKSLTESNVASFLAVILAGMGTFGSYLIAPSAVPIALSLILILLFLLQDPNKYLSWIISITLVIAFLSPTVFVLVLALLFLLLLLRIEGFGVEVKIGELFFFTLMLAVWFHVLLYKRALFTEGIRVLWQNLPSSYSALHFSNITFIALIYGLGTVTFLFGIFGIYHALFETHTKSAFSVISAILSLFTLLLLRVIELKLGILFLAVFLACMAGYGLLVTFRYVTRTKAPWLIYPLGVLVVLLFLFTSVLPSLASARVTLQDTPSSENIAAYTALRSTIPKGAVLLTTVREAAAVQYFSGQKTLTDHDFLFVRNGDELVRDIDAVYTSPFSVTIIGKADKLGFTHILFSNDAMQEYGKDQFLTDECFEQIPLSSAVFAYRVICTGVYR